MTETTSSPILLEFNRVGKKDWGYDENNAKSSARN